VKGFVPFALIDLIPAQKSVKDTRDVSLEAKCGCLLEIHRFTVAYVGMGKKTRRDVEHRYLN
jgi:hypothetical protein